MSISPPRKRTDGRWWIPSCAFLLSAGALLAAFACFGVFPFGEKTLITSDLNNQYVHFHASLRRLLLEGEGLLFSLRAGLGVNMLPLFAYYLASPFALLTLLFSPAALPEAMLCITVLKAGLAGALYAVFARRVLGARRSSLLFAPCYALCGFVASYASNIMWLDTIALLPLVMCCAHALVTRGRWGGLFASLILLFATQFYLSYMAGIFIFLCFAAMLWTYKPAKPWKTFLSFAAVTGGAALCCAALLLPTALRLFANLAVANTGYFFTWKLPFAFFDPLSRAFFGAFDSIQGMGLPPLYSGTATLLLLLPYFANKRIPWRERAGTGAIFALMMCSFWLPPLKLFWHAFELASWFQYRFAFVLSFLWVWAAHRCLTRLDGAPLWSIAGGGALALLFVTVLRPIHLLDTFRHAPFFARELIPWTVAVWSALLLALRITSAPKAALITKAAPKARWALLALCAALAVAEAGGNAYVTTLGIEQENTYAQEDAYVKREDFVLFFDRRAALLAQLPDDPGDPYRVESTSSYRSNDGLTLGYNGMQLFSSTADRALGNTLMRFGLGGRGFAYSHKGCTIALDSLLGIRYLMEPSDPNDYYEVYAEQDGLRAYENRDAFPLAFAAPPGVRDYRLPPQPLEETSFGHVLAYEDPFALQNQFFAVLGEEVYRPVPILSVEREALAVELQPNGDRKLRFVEGAGGISAEHLLACPKGEGPVYAYWAMCFESGAGALRADGRTLIKLSTGDAPVAAYVGDAWPDEEIALDFELEDDQIQLTVESLYQLDMDALGALCDAAHASAMYDISWKGGKLAGTVDATDERDTLLITIPYDGGWRAVVNGEPVAVERGLDLFCAVPLRPGRNDVRMRYAPPGFRTGVLLSGLGFAGLAVFLIARGALAARRRRA